MCEGVWLVALVLGAGLWLTGRELWWSAWDLEDARLAERVVLFGGTLMVLALPLTLVGSGTGG